MDGSVRKRCYKELLERGVKLHKGMSTIENSITAVEEVSHLISESNKLNCQTATTDNVNNIAEIVMDAQVMKMGHDILGVIVNRVCSSEFSTEEYCTAIHNRLARSGNSKWENLEKMIAKNFSFQSCRSSLLGSFDVQTSGVTEKLMKRRQLTSSQSALTKPVSVKQVSEENKGIEKLNLILCSIVKLYEENNRNPIPYFKLIIDPGDVMQTINNAFQIAFLVSNGSLTIEMDSVGLPLVKPIPRNRNLKVSSSYAQAVSKITEEVCQEMIEYYNIKEALIKY